MNSAAAAAWQRARRLWRDPLTVFLCAGLVLFGVDALVAERPEVIDVDRRTQEALFADYATLSGHVPDAAEKRRLLGDHIQDELLFREALKRGVHLSDGVVRARLTERMKTDLGGRPAEPAEDELLAFYASHKAAYTVEPAMSFDHVFFAAAPPDAAAVLARLNRGEAVAGDDFWMGSKLPRYGESMISATFGLQFMQDMRGLPLGKWAGPLTSSRGVHFVRVVQRHAPVVQSYAEVRGQVRQDFNAERAKAALAAEMERIGKSYTVNVAS